MDSIDNTSLRDKVQKSLEDLGSTADEVAAFLEGQGSIAPHWYNGNTCPIATYLNRVFRMEFGVSRHYTSPCPDSQDLYSVENPRPVQDFVWNFDHGAYPNLKQKRT